jgi:hypothetical protein
MKCGLFLDGLLGEEQEPAFTAERSCANSRRIRLFTSRSDDAHNSSAVSIDAKPVHDFPNHGDPMLQISSRFETKITAVMHLVWPVSQDGFRPIA